MICTLFALLVCREGICNEVKIDDGKMHLNGIVKKLQANKVKRVEILWRDPSAESRSTITPDILEKLYFRKLVIRDLQKYPNTKNLIKAVQATSLSKMDPEAEGDVRWAIKFYEDHQKNPASAIYLDGSGETGRVAGASYSFNRPLFDWLNKNFFAMSVPRRLKPVK